MGMELELVWPLCDLILLFFCFPIVGCIHPVAFFRLVDNLGGRGSQWSVVSVSSDLLVENPLIAPDLSLWIRGIGLLVSTGDSIS